jgi:hypothetical protein
MTQGHFAELSQHNPRALAPSGKARLRRRDLMETLGGFPNPRPLPATLHPARFARPRALWLRRAKPDFANAITSPHDALTE